MPRITVIILPEGGKSSRSHDICSMSSISWREVLRASRISCSIVGERSCGAVRSVWSTEISTDLAVRRRRCCSRVEASDAFGLWKLGGREGWEGEELGREGQCCAEGREDVLMEESLVDTLSI